MPRAWAGTKPTRLLEPAAEPDALSVVGRHDGDRRQREPIVGRILVPDDDAREQDVAEDRLPLERDQAQLGNERVGRAQRVHELRLVGARESVSHHAEDCRTVGRLLGTDQRGCAFLARACAMSERTPQEVAAYTRKTADIMAR